MPLDCGTALESQPHALRSESALVFRFSFLFLLTLRKKKTKVFFCKKYSQLVNFELVSKFEISTTCVSPLLANCKRCKATAEHNFSYDHKDT